MLELTYPFFFFLAVLRFELRACTCHLVHCHLSHTLEELTNKITPCYRGACILVGEQKALFSHLLIHKCLYKYQVLYLLSLLPLQ
jgi:hypothetical protein